MGKNECLLLAPRVLCVNKYNKTAALPGFNIAGRRFPATQKSDRFYGVFGGTAASVGHYLYKNSCSAPRTSSYHKPGKSDFLCMVWTGCIYLSLMGYTFK